MINKNTLSAEQAATLFSVELIAFLLPYQKNLFLYKTRKANGNHQRKLCM